jgi:hypothetical protein
MSLLRLVLMTLAVLVLVCSHIVRCTAYYILTMPGLNLLANYGYLPRNGLVNYEQVLDATSRGFNMGADLATVLAVFAILADGDIGELKGQLEVQTS